MTRERPSWETWDATLHELIEARAEIERLQAQLNQAADGYEETFNQVAVLRAEIERLTKERDHYLALTLEYQRAALEPGP